MAGITSMHYASNLPTLLENKRALGHYHNNPMATTGVYEADRGWDELLVHFQFPLKHQRAGATAKDKLNQIKRQIERNEGSLPSIASDDEAQLKSEE